MQQRSLRSDGFTLPEILLTLVCVGAIASFSIPAVQSLQTRNDINTAEISIIAALRQAQTLSQAVDGDSSWGIRLESHHITLFRGASFALRDSTFDEITDLANSVDIGGSQEIVFNKLFGDLNSPAAITVTAGSINEFRTISINIKGVVIAQ